MSDDGKIGPQNSNSAAVKSTRRAALQQLSGWRTHLLEDLGLPREKFVAELGDQPRLAKRYAPFVA